MKARQMSDDNENKRTEPGNNFVTYPTTSPDITVETRDEALKVQKEQREKKLNIVDMWQEEGLSPDPVPKSDS